MLLAKPEVLFRSWPGMQHHCWETGKIDLLVLPFLATYDPRVWLVCLGTLPVTFSWTFQALFMACPWRSQASVPHQLQLSSLWGMLKSSADILPLAAAYPLKNLPWEPTSHGSFHCLAVLDRPVLNILYCFLRVTAKFSKHSVWSTNEYVRV